MAVNLRATLHAQYLSLKLVISWSYLCLRFISRTMPTPQYRLLVLYLEKKLKYILVQALRLCTGRTAHRGSRVIALLFLDHCTRRGEGSASRIGRFLTPGKSRYPLYRRLVGTQGRSGQVRKISPPPGFDLRTVQPVASRYTDCAARPTCLVFGLHEICGM